MVLLFDIRNIIRSNNFIKDSNIYLTKYILSVLNNNIFEYELELLKNIKINYNEILLTLTNYYRSVNVPQDIEKFLTKEIEKLNTIATLLNLDIEKLNTILVNEIVFNPMYIHIIQDKLLNKIFIDLFSKLNTSYIHRYTCLYINFLDDNKNLNDHINHLFKLYNILPNNIWIYINYYYSRYIINILYKNINSLSLNDYVECYHKLKNILYCKYTNNIDNIISKLYKFINSSEDNILNNICIISTFDNIFNFSSKHRVIYINLISKLFTDDIHENIHSQINTLILNKNIPIEILSKTLLYIISAIGNDKIFFDIYYEYLFKRLESHYLTKNIDNIKYESDILKLFSFSPTYTYKCFKTINDFADSLEVLNYVNIDTTILITSVSTLDIDSTYNIYSNNLPNFQSKTSINEYINKYKRQFSSDIDVYFHLMYGKIVVKLNNSIITMLPIHYLLLNEELSLENIKIRAVKYGITDNNTLERLQNSFIGCFDGEDINLIEQFYNFNIDSNLSRAFSNKEVINSIIVNILKNISIDRDTLYYEIKKIIKLFIPSLQEINDSIRHLIQMDYIEENGNMLCIKND